MDRKKKIDYKKFKSSTKIQNYSNKHVFVNTTNTFFFLLIYVMLVPNVEPQIFKINWRYLGSHNYVLIFSLKNLWSDKKKLLKPLLWKTLPPPFLRIEILKGASCVFIFWDIFCELSVSDRLKIFSMVTRIDIFTIITFLL